MCKPELGVPSPLFAVLCRAPFSSIFSDGAAKTTAPPSAGKTRPKNSGDRLYQDRRLCVGLHTQCRGTPVEPIRRSLQNSAFPFQRRDSSPQVVGSSPVCYSEPCGFAPLREHSRARLQFAVTVVKLFTKVAGVKTGPVQPQLRGCTTATVGPVRTVPPLTVAA
jgi:hypothetical protein